MAEDASSSTGGTEPRLSDGLLAAALAGTGSPKVDALLDRQIAIADLQIEDLEREDSLRHWSLIVHHISDVLKLTFEFALAGIALAIVTGLGVAMWTAAHDNSLVIDAFSVPPDLAARGLTGHAIAAQVQDQLTGMQKLTGSARPADSYANNWGGDIKVQIPDTGVSIGEFYRMLVLWFGDRTHVTGEVFHAGKELAITARIGGGEGQVVRGDPGDVESLVKQAAEKIYGVTQPYRFATYLGRNSLQNPDARARFLQRMRQLRDHGTLADRIWAYTALATDAQITDPMRAPAISRQDIRLAPGFALGYLNAAYDERAIGHPEAGLRYGRKVEALLSQGNAGMSSPTHDSSLARISAENAEALGDFAGALRDFQKTIRLPDYSGDVIVARIGRVRSLARLHEPNAARRALEALPAQPNSVSTFYLGFFTARIRAAIGDWQAILSDRAGYKSRMANLPPPPVVTARFKTEITGRRYWPFVAQALAHTGQFAAAHALIARTPTDCYECLRIRGEIDTLEKNWTGAAQWYARAVKAAPSIPFAYTEWGAMLLREGKLDAAIAKFARANRKGPHFADPLEMSGEALIAKNRSDLAVAKFKQANKYTPKWGRLHLKWGEALLWSGDKADAKKQFALATSLWLTPSEKKQLAKVRHG